MLGPVEIIKATEKQGTKMVCSCTGNSLHADKASLGYDLRIGSQNELSGCRGERWQSDDGKVFMIEGRVIQ